MNYRFLFSIIGSILISFSALAQDGNEGVTSFSKAEDSWRRNKTEEKVQPLPQFVSSAGSLAMKTIMEAEQVFCYEVFPQDPNFEGYTIEGFPVRGFCGMLAPQVRNIISTSLFASKLVVDFNNEERCVIQPKLMLRFVRGVDYADVLLSSPCYALAIFYGGSSNVYNYSPSAEVIDMLIKNFGERHQEFVSPALLNQVLPIGVAQNAEQKKIVNKNREPIRQWEAQAKENVKKQEEELKRQSTGWNKLKTQK